MLYYLWGKRVAHLAWTNDILSSNIGGGQFNNFKNIIDNESLRCKVYYLSYMIKIT